MIIKCKQSIKYGIGNQNAKFVKNIICGVNCPFRNIIAHEIERGEQFCMRNFPSTRNNRMYLSLTLAIIVKRVSLPNPHNNREEACG